LPQQHGDRRRRDGKETVLCDRRCDGLVACVAALEEALLRHGRPKIFNTDQGSQFTSAAFTGRLEAASVSISMDGRGRFMAPRNSRPCAWGNSGPAAMMPKAVWRAGMDKIETAAISRLRKKLGRDAIRTAVSDFVAWRLRSARWRRRESNYATRTQMACPRSRIRLSDLTAIATSVTRRASSRDFKISPITRL
jgi:hypothetical protein